MTSHSGRERPDADRSSTVQIDNPAARPVFEYARQNSGAVAEQELARTDRKREVAVRPEVMRRVVRQWSIIRLALARIREGASDFAGDSEVLAPRVSGLKINPVNGAHRERCRHRVIVV